MQQLKTWQQLREEAAHSAADAEISGTRAVSFTEIYAEQYPQRQLSF